MILELCVDGFNLRWTVLKLNRIHRLHKYGQKPIDPVHLPILPGPGV